MGKGVISKTIRHVKVSYFVIEFGMIEAFLFKQASVECVTPMLYTDQCASKISGSKTPTSRRNMKLYFELFFSRSLSIRSYTNPWPLTSAATALIKVSVMSSSSRALRTGLKERLRGDRLREES